MAVTRNAVVSRALNRKAALPYELRVEDFASAMQDIYDFFFDVKSNPVESRTLAENHFFDGHPDLIVRGRYPQDSVKAGEHGD